jgi:hypothetical protein
MPYNKEQQMIHTKLVEVVNRKSNSDNMIISRQDLLKKLYLNPEVCKFMYIAEGVDKMKYVVFTTHDEPDVKWQLGMVQSKYYKLLDSKYYKIMAWRITGGQTISDKVRAYYGMNLAIKIVGDKVVQQEIALEQVEDEQV